MSFRLEHITVRERVAIAATCLACAGQYGMITALAAAGGTSRQFSYDLRDRGEAALLAALAPGRAGRPPVRRALGVERLAVDRAIQITRRRRRGSPPAGGRGIQACLDEILQVRRSVGAIQAVLTEAARRAVARLACGRRRWCSSWRRSWSCSGRRGSASRCSPRAMAARTGWTRPPL